jgi:predicted 2-oxoglutarate/Fe(II)-dependent dioxygenase YbiX
MNYDYWHWPSVFKHKDLISFHNTFKDTCNNKAVETPAENATKKLILKMSYWSNFKNELNDLEQKILKVNQENFGYNIWSQLDTDLIKLNEYDISNNQYDWHTDGSNNHTYDVKFTVLINASIQPYKGGEFYLMGNGGEYHVEGLDRPGDVICIKSHIHHKVNPVTEGKRHTIVIHYSGPRFI